MRAAACDSTTCATRRRRCCVGLASSDDAASECAKWEKRVNELEHRKDLQDRVPIVFREEVRQKKIQELAEMEKKKSLSNTEWDKANELRRKLYGPEHQRMRTFALPNAKELQAKVKHQEPKLAEELRKRLGR